jgi:hypothetical protein
MVDEDDRTVKEPPTLFPISRREFLAVGFALVGPSASSLGRPDAIRSRDVHQQILDLAAQQHERRRARFRSVGSKTDLEALQTSLREAFLRLLDGLTAMAGVPAARSMGTIDAGDYVIEKLAYERFPGCFVPALLYRP